MMKLYKTGFGEVMFYVAANSASEAITKVQKERNMSYLPVTATEVVEEFGLSILCLTGNVEAESVEDSCGSRIQGNKATRRG